MEEREKHRKSKITSDDKKESDLLENIIWKKVLKHLQKKNKNMFKHINKAGEEFKEGNGPRHL